MKDSLWFLLERHELHESKLTFFMGVDNEKSLIKCCKILVDG